MTKKSNKSKKSKKSNNNSLKALADRLSSSLSLSPRTSHTLILRRPLTGTPTTRSRCNPHIYLSSHDVLFQVSFNDPDNIVFPNATKYSILDCGYKALSALGLRNLQRSLMESNLVNRKGTSGIDTRDMEAYITFIFDLKGTKPVTSVFHDLYGGPLLLTEPVKGDDTVINNHFTLELQPNYATVFLVKLENNTNISEFFYHYLVAYNVNGVIYYYNPQTNLPRNPPDMYLSTSVGQLFRTVAPEYHLEDEFIYFNISEHGVPRPVIKSRLKAPLQFFGGRHQRRHQHSRVCKSRKICKSRK